MKIVNDVSGTQLVLFHSRMQPLSAITKCFESQWTARKQTPVFSKCFEVLHSHTWHTSGALLWIPHKLDVRIDFNSETFSGRMIQISRVAYYDILLETTNTLLYHIFDSSGKFYLMIHVVFPMNSTDSSDAEHFSDLHSIMTPGKVVRKTSTSSS